MKTIETIRPFKKMLMTIGNLPTAFLESMTYYEALAWFCDFLQNTVIPTVNNNAEAVKELQDLFIELHDYVKNYFDNLDVQEEINNKLDEMVEDGTLQNILQQFLNLVRFYDTVDEMIADTNLGEGLICKTLGFYAKDDLGGAYYKIEEHETDDSNQKSIIKLDNDLYAVYIDDINRNVRQFGAVGDGLTDDTLSFTLAGANSFVPAGNYYIDSNYADASVDYKNYNGYGKIIYNDISWYVGRNEKGTLYINNDLEFNNGNEIVPRVSHDGMINILDSQLKFFADMDGDGDYDADVYSQSNMYLSCGANLHLIRGQLDDLTKAESYGRIVIAGTANTNFIQTGKDYSATEFKHLAFSKYRSTDYFMIFNHNTGYTGIGKYYSDPKARCHISSDENTVLILENKSGENVRMTFKTTNESAEDYTAASIGLEDGVMVLRAGGTEKLRLEEEEDYVLPGVSGTTRLGSEIYPWNNVYSKNFYFLGDVATLGVIENTAGTGSRIAFRNTSVSGTNCTIGLDGSAFIMRTGGANKLKIDSGNYVLPGIASTTNLGSTSYPWANVYTVNPVTVTSDRRAKNNINDINAKIFDAWKNIKYKEYKINEGDNKIHFGIIAQDIIEEFEKVGLNALDYGLVVYDEENDIYCVRYEEINILENAYIRYKIDN